MEECLNCGILETKTILFDAISPEGIAKICGKCSAKENIPIIKDGFLFQNEKKQTVHERLSKISGVSLKKKNDDKKKQETSLRNIVDSNFKEEFRNDSNSKKYLIDNFHWVIMRARRSKKLTQEQFAEIIHEPVKAIKLIEEGFVPEKKEIIDKLENYLRIRIKKNNEKTGEEVNFLDVSSKLEQSKKVEKIELADFDFENVKNLTIADLQEMKKKKEEFLDE
jgi:ribosome-binding protein aMBF1 (putative translation factor)|tara:strand:- start:528 stop:1196 length:669 start_codon:yes stop_codon:yes gene_type:complete